MTHRHSEEHPTRNEDEYFARENAELIKQMRERLDGQRKEQERRNHFMKCPKCGADLTEKAFDQVKVDICPECDGIWLDKGEIEVLRQISTSRGAAARVMDHLLGLFHHSK